MIFGNNLLNLPSGSNMSLFAFDENKLIIYFYNNGLKKKKLILDRINRYENLDQKYDCEYIYQISSNHLCLCFDGNISVVDCEN